MMDINFIRIASKAITGAAIVVFTSACNDPTSQGVANLAPYWQLDVDNASKQVLALGFVSDASNEPTASEIAKPLFSNAVRLTDGDALSIVWSDSNWQLYRRDAGFSYSRTFPQPSDNQTFEARFARPNSAFESITVRASIPDLSSVMLVEEGLEVPGTATLNLSWEVDTSLHDLRNQTVDVILQACNDVSVDSSMIVTTAALDAEIDARSLIIPVSDLPRAPSIGAQTCRYGIRLTTDTVKNTEGYVDITTRSRLFETVVSFAAGAE